MPSRLRSLVDALFRRKRFENAMDGEIRFHLEAYVEDLVNSGVARAEAERRARLEFGGIEGMKEECRQARGLRLADELWQDIRYTVRQLRKNPGFTAAAILTLGLGIGANTAIFSFVDSVLLKRLPYPEPDRIVRVLQMLPERRGVFPITTMDFLDWQKQNTVFEFIAAQRQWNTTLTGLDEPVLLRGMRVSAGYYDAWRIQPFLGRTFTDEEDQYGKDHIVILSHDFWMTRFGADRTIIGRTVMLDNEPYTVVGVMPAGSMFDRAAFQITKPMAFAPFEMTRGLHWLTAVGRLKPGVTIEEARAQMDAMAAQFSNAYPATNNGFGISIERFSEVLVGSQIRTALLVLLAAAGMVLLIGCANLANLSLVRGISREKEVALRASIGAGRGRLVRQFLIENVVLAVLGGSFGIGLGYATMVWLRVTVPSYSLPAEADVQLDGRVLLFALGLSLLTGLLFGLAPALQLTKPDLTGAMKQGGRGSTSGGARRRVRNALVIAEIALSFVLLTGSGLLIRSFFGLQNVDLGFNSTNILTMSLPTPPAQYPDLAQLTNYLGEIRSAVENLPGVRDTAFAAVVPLRGTSYRLPMLLAGSPPVDRPRRGLYFFKLVSPSYFDVFGIQVRQGRALDKHDIKGSPLAVVINERLADRLFPNESPVGRRILIPQILPGKPDLGDDVEHEIVGVIANEKVSAVNDAVTEGVYGAIEQNPFYNPSLAVLASVDPQTLQKSIRTAIDSVNKNQVLADVKTMEQIKSESILDSRFQTTLLAAFSGVALLLAAVGIYGVISYSVLQRAHEMGIRAALGANAASLRLLVLGHGLALTLAGLTLGVAGSLALTRALSRFLFGVGAHDPLTMALVAVTLVVVSLIACYVPARRATKVDSMAVLQ